MALLKILSKVSVFGSVKELKLDTGLQIFLFNKTGNHLSNLFWNSLHDRLHPCFDLIIIPEKKPGHNRFLEFLLLLLL